MRVLPLAYACSGCSSAGELADHVARCLERAGVVEMASIAAIGAGDLRQLARARSRLQVVAIDGCDNGCARRCLERRGIEPARHYVLARYGVGKRSRAHFTTDEAGRALKAMVKDLG